MRLFFQIIILVILISFHSLSAAVENKTYSKDEMAECFVLMLKESFKPKGIDTYNKAAVEKKINACTKCGLPYTGEPCCTCTMCGYCGSKRAKLTGWHYPDCVCPYCGGKGGYHVNCDSTDWDGFEEHDFQKIIEKTTSAINKNSNNKDAYFNRGVAYFELGVFDEALNDYRFSHQGKLQPKSSYKASKEFVVAFLEGIQNGSLEAAVEFIPSLCSTTYGMSKTLWICVQHPLDSFVNLANACYEVGENTFNYCKKINWETIEEYSDQIQAISQKFNQLSETEKGELIGHTLGKYGVDFIACSVLGTSTYRGFTAVRNLKNANRVCNLEAMAASAVDKEMMTLAAQEHALSRRSYFESVKYNYDSHSKHLLDHHYHDGKRSIWEHPDPERLLRTFAGKGQPKTGTPCVPGYRELVDFKEHIGIWKENKVGGLALPTTRGIIHYGKKGAHIVPASPKSTIGAK